MSFKLDYVPCGLARVAKYKGLREPQCNGGTGCRRCWDKYNSVPAMLLREDMKPGHSKYL